MRVPLVRTTVSAPAPGASNTAAASAQAARADGRRGMNTLRGRWVCRLNPIDKLSRRNFAEPLRTLWSRIGRRSSDLLADRVFKPPDLLNLDDDHVPVLHPHRRRAGE